MTPYNRSRLSKKIGTRSCITTCPATIGVAICLVAILAGCAVYIQRSDNRVSPSATTSSDNGTTAIPQNVDWLRPQATLSAIALSPGSPVEQGIVPTAIHTAIDISRQVAQKADTRDADNDVASRHVGIAREAKAVRCHTSNTWFLPLRERNMAVTAGFGYYDTESAYFKTLDAVGGLRKDAQGVYHPGLDFRSGLNAPVFAVADATVEAVKYSDQYGLYVTLRLTDSQGDIEREVIYGHLSDSFVTAGQLVRCGQILALTGASGKAIKGAHLHFEVREAGQSINPLPFVAQAREAVMPADLTEGQTQ